MKEQSKKLYEIALAGFVLAIIILDSHLNDISAVHLVSRTLYMLYGVAALMRLSALAHSYTTREKLLFIAALIPAGLAFLCDKTFSILAVTPLMTMCAKGSRYRDHVRVFLIAIVLGVALVVAAYLAGFITAFEKDVPNKLLGGIVQHRNSLGFGHVNTLSMYLLMAGLAYLYLRWDEFGPRDYACTLAASCIVFFVLGSKTSPLLMVAALTVRRLNDLTAPGVMKASLVTAAIAAVILGFVLPAAYDPSSHLLAAANSFLTGRLYLEHANLMANSLSLLPQTPADLGLTIDSSYIFVLINYGVIVLLSLAAGYMAAVKKGLRSSDIALLTIIALALALGNMEQWLLTKYAYFIIPAIMCDAAASATAAYTPPSGHSPQ